MALPVGTAKDHVVTAGVDDITTTSREKAAGDLGLCNPAAHCHASMPPAPGHPNANVSAPPLFQASLDTRGGAVYQTQRPPQVQPPSSPSSSAHAEDSAAGSAGGARGAGFLQIPLLLQPPPPQPVNSFAGLPSAHFAPGAPGLLAPQMMQNLMPPPPSLPMPWGALGDMGAFGASSTFFAPPMPSQMLPPSMLLPPSQILPSQMLPPPMLPPPASPYYYGPPYGAPPMIAGAMASFGPGALGLLPLPPPPPLHSFHLMPPPLPLAHLTKDELLREQKRAANRRSAHVSREKRRLFADEVAAASRSLKWHKRIVDMLPDLVISVNRHGSITFASKSVLARLRVSPRVVGTSVFEIVAPAARGAVAALLQQSTTLLGKGPHFAEIYLLTSGGSALRCEASAVAAATENGFVEAVVSLRPCAELEPSPLAPPLADPLPTRMAHAAPSSSSSEAAISQPALTSNRGTNVFVASSEST